MYACGKELLVLIVTFVASAIARVLWTIEQKAGEVYVGSAVNQPNRE